MEDILNTISLSNLGSEDELIDDIEEQVCEGFYCDEGLSRLDFKKIADIIYSSFWDNDMCREEIINDAISTYMCRRKVGKK